TATIDIKNTGRRLGDEVVQLYTRQLSPSVIRPSKELRGFQRLTLQPDEKKTVTFTLPAAKLAFYDEHKHAFVTESGKYEIMVGSSSADIRAKARVEVMDVTE